MAHINLLHPNYMRLSPWSIQRNRGVWLRRYSCYSANWRFLACYLAILQPISGAVRPKSLIHMEADTLLMLITVNMSSNHRYVWRKSRDIIKNMEGSDLSILIFFAAIVFIWLLPILIIISSSKTTGGEKLAWVIAVIFISWFAWVFYMLLAPIKNKNRNPEG